MRIPVAILALVLLAPGGAACSLAYQEFWIGDMEGDRIATAIGHQATAINLATGQQTILAQDYFPAVAVAGGYIFHSGQDGLGAGCEGDSYFEVYDGTNTVVHEPTAVDSFAADGDRFVTLRGETLEVRRTGTWAKVVSFQFDRGEVEETPFGSSEGAAASLALDTANQRIAANDRIGNIVVFDFAGTTIAEIPAINSQQPELAWFQGKLVIGARQQGAAAFYVVDDLATGTAHKFTLSSQDWRNMAIGGGSSLYLQHGDQVLRIEGATSKKLVVPSQYEIGAVAGDTTSAVLLVTEADGYGGGDGVGIQRLTGATFGSWYTKNLVGNWAAGTNPGFSWAAGQNGQEVNLLGQNGNGGTGGEGEPTSEHGDKGIPGFAAPLLAIALLAARRMH